jgi:hypothetical protein
MEKRKELGVPSQRETYQQFLDRPSPVLGFKTNGEFRDATRPLAQNHRESKVIVSGSSVTGRSFHTGLPFGPKSDIDIGLVNKKLRYNTSQTLASGFPVPESKLGREEVQLQESFRRKTGIKVFNRLPDRPLIERPHTPDLPFADKPGAIAQPLQIPVPIKPLSITRPVPLQQKVTPLFSESDFPPLPTSSTSSQIKKIGK